MGSTCLGNWPQHKLYDPGSQINLEFNLGPFGMSTSPPPNFYPDVATRKCLKGFFVFQSVSPHWRHIQNKRIKFKQLWERGRQRQTEKVRKIEWESVFV